MAIPVIGDSAGTLAPESLRPDRPRRRRPTPTGQVGSAPHGTDSVRRDPSYQPRSSPSGASGKSSSKGCICLNFGNPSRRGNPVGNPEKHAGPSEAISGLTLQSERGFPWWKGIRGISSPVAGGRCRSDGRRRGLLLARLHREGHREKCGRPLGSPRPIKLGGAKRRLELGGPPPPR